MERGDQDALGTANDSDGAAELPASDGAVLGRVVVDEVGLEVAAGVLHAATAPPSEAARARAIRILLTMGLGILRCRAPTLRRLA
jgi:hypothetical protein